VETHRATLVYISFTTTGKVMGNIVFHSETSYQTRKVGVVIGSTPSSLMLVNTEKKKKNFYQPTPLFLPIHVSTLHE
jgi:hypothetical protein